MQTTFGRPINQEVEMTIALIGVACLGLVFELAAGAAELTSRK
jgi:hypothetical protein